MHELRDDPLKLAATIAAAVFVSYFAVCIKMLATGPAAHGYGDFYALWSSAVITHDGSSLVNYDQLGLHFRQLQLGMKAQENSPFPYPPTFLLALAPLGGLSRPAAFWTYMAVSFTLYLLAMAFRRDGMWRWAAGAICAPATTITMISGQSGFLSGALMVGGLRLAASRPLLSGVLFGLLTFKPQLGVLVPIALVAGRLWRTIFMAVVTTIACVIVSSCAFGSEIWPAWLISLRGYAEFYPLTDLMPTIYANALALHAPGGIAMTLQLCASVSVAIVVWRAFREGVTARAQSLLLVGTFLATPHALNYDMPMATAAVLSYLFVRYDSSRSLAVGEIVALLLMLVLPFLMIPARGVVPGFTWAPEILLFVMLARKDAWEAAPHSAPEAAQHPQMPRVSDGVFISSIAQN